VRLYHKYVTMGAVVVSKQRAIGRQGSKLCVRTPHAECICHRVRGVPAEQACIDFVEDSGAEEGDRRHLRIDTCSLMRR